MKKLMLLSLLLLIPCAYAQNDVELYFFYGEGCPHCGAAQPFLDELEVKYPELTINRYEVYFSDENRNRLYSMAEAYGEEVKGVPAFFIDKKVIFGYNTNIGEQIEQEIQRCISEGCVCPGGITENEIETIEGDTSPMADDSKVTIPTLIGAAAVDAINPCTIAVLIILLTTVLAAGKKLRILGAGMAFTATIFISYFLMGLGFYTALQASGVMHLFFYFVIAIALLVGVLSIKSYFKYKPGGWAVEMPAKWRPIIKKIISGVTSIPGAAFVGFVCSLFLLPCSSGPYLVILGLLAKETTRQSAIPLLAMYNFIFVLPMIIITALVYQGATNIDKISMWKEKYIKILHLISGTIMIGLAGLLAASIYFGWV